MRVAVLGGAGFIGSNFIRQVAHLWDVLVYDALTYAGRLENLKDVLDKVKFVKGDIADEALLHKTLQDFQPDLVVNFAAETHVDRSINEPARFFKTNVLGIYAVLETLRKIDAALLHVSTDEVYGDLWGVENAADENSCLNPSSPYSASKAAGDLFIKAYGRTYGVKYKIVRPSNNYGPFQHPEKLIPRTIIRILFGKPAVIYGDGKQIRDWLYVEDTAKAIVTVIERGGWREIYNICGGFYATVEDVVRKVVEILGRGVVVYGKSRPGEDKKYAMKCDKITSLGWRPSVSLDVGILKTVKWYVENRWWWENLVDEYVMLDTPWK